MNSSMHSSELALAELGCAHIQRKENATVLVRYGPLEMTLRSPLSLKEPSLRLRLKK